jgi:hypothetical protein
MSRKRDWSRPGWENLPNARFYDPQPIPDADPEVDKRELEDMDAVLRFRKANAAPAPKTVAPSAAWQKRFKIGMTVRSEIFGFGVIENFTDTDMSVRFPRIKRIEWLDEAAAAKLQI